MIRHHKKIVTTVLLAVVSFWCVAQNEDDIVRFSKLGFTGSARFMGMGGAMGALGADYSVVTINPAGLARFSGNVFSITPSLDMTSSTGIFSGTETRTTDASLGLPDISLVRNFTNTKGGWNSFQVAVGYSRLTNLSNESVYEGEARTSMLHDFAENAYGLEPFELPEFLPFTSSPAYDTYAINDAPFYDDNGNVYYIPEIPYDSLVHHRRSINRTGHQGEFNFALSGNYGNKFYIGGSIGIQRVKYNDIWVHRETLIDTTDLFLRSFDYTYDLDIIGTGVNIKVGAIYLPEDWLRIGLAIHSPTRFVMNDRWTSDMTTEFTDGIIDLPNEFIATGGFSYVTRTPFRATASGAMILNKRGVFSVDIDYIDYSSAIFKPRRKDQFTDYTLTNNDIRDRLRSAFNIRTGADIRIKGGFSWRVGMGFYGNAFRDELINTKPNRRYYSTGFGLRYEKFSFDMAYMLHRWNEDYFAYFTEEGPTTAVLRNSYSVISATLGFKF